MQRRFLRASGLLAATCVVACATPTRLVGTWQNDNYNKRLLRKVLVIANTPDMRIRQMAETEFVRQFEERKVQALPSYEILGSQTEINRENVEKAIRDTDIDAVFAIGVVDERTEDREVPGVTHNYSEPPRYYYNFYDYNERSSTSISAPGYTTTSQIYLLESNLYDAGTADLMWTATTQTTDPRSAEEALPPLSRVLMKTLDRGGFFR
jgi:hypothetical protein